MCCYVDARYLSLYNLLLIEAYQKLLVLGILYIS